MMTGWARKWVIPRISKWQSSSRSDLFLPMLVAAVDLPVEFALSSLSGNNFPHYFMMLLPSLTLLIAFVARSVFWLAGTSAGKAMPYVWLFAIMTPVLAPGIIRTADSLRPLGEREEVGSVVAY